jgi:predicted phage tail protein
LQAKNSALPGNIDLAWKKVTGNKMYVVQMTTVADAQTGWATIGLVTKAKFTAMALVAGHKYWFRVAAQNSIGQSAFSDVVQLMALG